MKKYIIFLSLITIALCGCSKNEVNISCNETKNKINNGAILVDVRTFQEYNEEHLESSINSPLDSIDKIEEEVIDITTLAFNLPSFIALSAEKVSQDILKVSYEFDDEDDIAEEIYIVLLKDGSEVSRQKVTRKRGSIEFSGLDLTKDGYTVKMQATYYATEGAMFADVCESEELIIEPIVVEDGGNDETPKKGCKKSSAELVIATTSALSLAVLILRKKK